MVYQIAEHTGTLCRLSRAVLQIVDMPGLLRAELARILQIKCGDIGRLAAAMFLCPYIIHAGDGVAMRHWLLDSSPQGG